MGERQVSGKSVDKQEQENPGNGQKCHKNNGWHPDEPRKKRKHSKTKLKTKKNSKTNKQKTKQNNNNKKKASQNIATTITTTVK